jgi:Peptidase family M23
VKTRSWHNIPAQAPWFYMGVITQHLPIQHLPIQHLPIGITYPASTMPPRRLSLGADNRYIIQTIAYSSQYSCPIPSWATESAPAEISDIEKLKHFCGSNCGYLYHPAQLERRSVWGRPLAQVLCLMGLAMPLSLHASKSYSQAGLDHALKAIGLKSVVSAPGATIPQPQALTTASNPTAPKLPKLTDTDQSGHQFSLPVTGFAMTSSFGNRIHPIFGNVRFHKGIDLGTPIGTPIRAARDGRVASAGWGQGYGNRIIIDHGNGYETLYAHLDRLVVKVGDRVTKKAVIGLSGSTGHVTGPHLHFEIRLNQVAQNPTDYLKGYFKKD